MEGRLEEAVADFSPLVWYEFTLNLHGFVNLSICSIRQSEPILGQKSMGVIFGQLFLSNLNNMLK